ncbi:aminoacyl-tRNA hydrolase [Buchnera aphidicola]|uniref:aminoacyl-tRNA hydrolase n=1 Tax=Buchnera aphidicola TaxID=9 RepID=UPI003464D6FD
MGVYNQMYLLIPNTFINICGSSIFSALRIYNIKIKDMLIFHDELDLSIGDVRFKNGIGHNGHNGLRNIIKNIGSGNIFKRIAIGIGRPLERSEIVEYVLSKFTYIEKNKIYESIKSIIYNLNQLKKNWNSFSINRNLN